MEKVTSTIRELLARAEAGEVVGVAFTAQLKGGPMWTAWIGDTQGKWVQIVDSRTGDREDVEQSA